MLAVSVRLGPSQSSRALALDLLRHEGLVMKRRGMRNIFSDEDIELMLTIRREEEERALRVAQKSARGKRSAKPRAAEPAPDRRTASKKRTDKDGAAPPPRD